MSKIARFSYKALATIYPVTHDDWTNSDVYGTPYLINCAWERTDGTATDSNGNVSNAETIKFAVKDESSATEKKDNKVGIILIVVSLVVLAGLVCFFAFGGKAKTSVPKSLKPKKDEKTEDEKTQE